MTDFHFLCDGGRLSNVIRNFRVFLCSTILGWSLLSLRLPKTGLRWTTNIYQLYKHIEFKKDPIH